MSIRNGSGHDVEYEVEEGEPPPGPGIVEVPANAMFASMAFTFTGTALLTLGCLPQFGRPLLSWTGALAVGISLGIQGYAVAAGRRRRPAKPRVLYSRGGRPKLAAGKTADYTFNPGDRVHFYWTDDEGAKTASSEPVSDPGSLVELVEVEPLAPGDPSHQVVISV
jgi:hypothetical protein